MPWPEYIPIFVPDDILIDPENYSNGKGQYTLVGWIKELFLFSYVDKTHLWITEDDRRIHRFVLDVIKKRGIIKGQSLHDFEDSATAKQQAKALNEIRKALKYTEIEDR
jgi:hypothetical protein